MRKSLSLAIAGALLAGAAVAQDSPRKGGTLVIALNADIRSVEPGINRDANTDTAIHQMFEGLVAYRTDLSVGPALADAWSVADEGRTYRFVLRDGVRFHNGAPLTAAEVKWAWDRLSKQPAWNCRGAFDGSAGAKVLAVEAVDARTVVYRLEAPSALFLKQLANIQCAVLVYHPDSVDAAGKWKMPIGSGPLKLKEWKRDEYVLFERFADYRPSGAPASGFSGARNVYVDQVQFRVIPDASSRDAALQTGAVDVITEVEPRQIAEMKQRGMSVLTSPGLGWTAFLVNTNDPLLSNLKIRQAMAHAINLDQIAEQRTAGLTKANPSAVSLSTAYFDNSFRAWPAYDPKKAAALLKEAGYAGQPIRIQTNKRYTGMYENSVMIHAMLSAAGFRADLEVLDWATQLDNYLKHSFQVQSFGYSPRFDPGLMYGVILADQSK
ncbi:MAG: ABC transporter substrate-binding protein, partial [Proteobacteria bacterium]|nr:ABC transporter substrate-binding protein [Pseudomonadota bacterium]